MTPKSAPPDQTLYHYTSPAGLLNIVMSESIHATDAGFLNDVEELQHGIDLFNDEVLEMEERGELPTDVLPYIDHSMALARQETAFVACFSAEPNLLSQWRAYCPKPGGYALGFSHRGLKEVASHLGKAEGWETSLGCCIYDDTEKRRQGSQRLRRVATFLSMTGPKVTDDMLEEAGKYVYADLVGWSPLFKNAGFREEMEHRLIIQAGKSASPREAADYRAGTASLIPYIPVPLRLPSGALPLTEVVIGPTVDMPRARDALESFLARRGLTAVKVVASDIPFRA